MVGISWDLGMRPALLRTLLPDIGEYLSRYVRPDFSNWPSYLRLLWQTVSIAIWGTTLSFLISFASAPFAAGNFTPAPTLYRVVRHGQVFLRAMPDLLLALIFVSAVGLGPMPGIMALALHTSGFLGKFFAESLERVDKGSCEALRASGAGYLQVLFFAGWPAILREMIGHTLYIFDRNVRMAMVLGPVGAGGIGRTLPDNLRVFKYNQASAGTIFVLAPTIIIDAMATSLRRRVL